MWTGEHEESHNLIHRSPNASIHSFSKGLVALLSEENKGNSRTISDIHYIRDIALCTYDHIQNVYSESL